MSNTVLRIYYLATIRKMIVLALDYNLLGIFRMTLIWFSSTN